MFIGEWAESRGIRDQLVIATKVRIPHTYTIGEGLTFYKKIVYYCIQTGRRDQN